MQRSLQQAIRDEALRPASAPRVDVVPERVDAGDLEFSALVEVYPEIEPIDVGALTIERPAAEVSDQDVDDMLETLRQQRKTWETVERKVDQAAVGFTVGLQPCPWVQEILRTPQCLMHFGEVPGLDEPIKADSEE